MSQPAIPASEVADVMRRALRGDVAVRLLEPEWTWDRVYAGDCGFMFGDWGLSFFNDCQELDYCDYAKAPDGRQTNFAQWWDAHGNDPVGLLSQSELAAMEDLLEGLR